jgi:hypothetical protein
MNNFFKKEEPKFGEKHPIVATVLAALAPDVVNKGYFGLVNPLMRQSKNVARSAEQQKIVEELIQQMKNKGYTVDDYRRDLASRGKPTMPHHAAVNLFNNQAYIPKNTNPGIAAHELGHILGPKILGKIQFPGKIGGSIMSLSSLFRQDKEKAKRDASIASGILGATLLPSEIDASIRGYKALGALDKTKGALRPELLSRLSRLRSFAGLPTYTIAAMAPLLTYKLRDTFGALTPSKKQ